MEQYKLISADSYIVEPPDMYTGRIELKFRDRAPRMERRKPPAGREYDAWMLDGMQIGTLGAVMQAGQRFEDPSQIDFLGVWEDVRKGGYDAHAMIRDPTAYQGGPRHQRELCGIGQTVASACKGRAPSAFWQAEDALADDVALDLAGPAGNRVLAGAEHAVVPARGVGNRLGRRVDGRKRAEQGGREIGDTQSQLRAEQFEDRAFRPRRFAAQPAGQPTQPCHLQRLDVDRQLRELLADMALASGRLLATGELLCEFGEAGDLGGVVAAASAAALEHQSRDRNLPALVKRPNEIFLRHCHVFEEYLVEVAVPVEQHQRPNRNPRRLHVGEQILMP